MPFFSFLPSRNSLSHVLGVSHNKPPLSSLTASAVTSAYPAGKLHCCNCNEAKDIYLHDQMHPLGIMVCSCDHIACEACLFSGRVTNFVPITELLPVPISQEALLRAPYGIVCSSCGLSWRAEGIQCLGKVPSLLAPPSRIQHEGGKLKKRFEDMQALFSSAPLTQLHSKSMTFRTKT
jgi:hypothetical protein